MKRILILMVMLAMSGCSNGEQVPLPTLEPPVATSTAAASTPVPVTGDVTQTTVPEATTPPAQPTTAFPDPSAFKWAPVASGFREPTDIQFPDDGSGRMFVLDQSGQIRMAKDGQPA